MPQEGIPHVVKVVNLITIVTLLELFVGTCLQDFSREDGPFEVDCISNVDFAEINEVVCSFEVLYRLPHKFDVEVVPGEEVFVSSTSAPISGIEISNYLFTSNYPYVLGQDRVHHAAVVHLRLLPFTITTLLYIRTQIEAYHITHCRNALICPPRPGKRLIRRKTLGNQAEGVQGFKDILLDAVIRLGLTSHTVVVVSKITDLQRILSQLILFEQLGKFGLIGPPQHFLLEGLMISESVLESLVLLLQVVNGGDELFVGELTVVLAVFTIVGLFVLVWLRLMLIH